VTEHFKKADFVTRFCVFVTPCLLNHNKCDLVTLNVIMYAQR